MPDLEAWSLAENRPTKVNISTAREGNLIFVSTFFIQTGKISPDLSGHTGPYQKAFSVTVNKI